MIVADFLWILRFLVIFFLAAKVGDDRRLLGFASDPLGVQDASATIHRTARLG